jgi:hypothetical protein
MAARAPLASTWPASLRPDLAYPLSNAAFRFFFHLDQNVDERKKASSVPYQGMLPKA